MNDERYSTLIASDVYKRVNIRIYQDIARESNEYAYITPTWTTSKEYRVVLKGNAFDLPVGISVGECFKDGYLAERDEHKIVIKAFKADGLMRSAKNYIDKVHGGSPLEEEKKMTKINITNSDDEKEIDLNSVQAGDVFVDEDDYVYQLISDVDSYFCVDWNTGDKATKCHSSASAAVKELDDCFDGLRKVDTVNISYKIKKRG